MWFAVRSPNPSVLGPRLIFFRSEPSPMRMHHLAAAAGVLALTLVVSCNDETPRPEAAVAPTASNDKSALTPDAGPNMAVAIGNQIASVCKSYKKASRQAK